MPLFGREFIHRRDIIPEKNLYVPDPDIFWEKQCILTDYGGHSPKWRKSMRSFWADQGRAEILTRNRTTIFTSTAQEYRRKAQEDRFLRNSAPGRKSQISFGSLRTTARSRTEPTSTSCTETLSSSRTKSHQSQNGTTRATAIRPAYGTTF
mgnify:CR=1 FL=1